MEVSAEGATLSGILVGLVSLIIGKIWGGHGKVTETQCRERREACHQLTTSHCSDLVRRVTVLEELKNRIN